MNLFRPQLPYVFRPPKYSPWFKPVMTLLSHFFHRRRGRGQALHFGMAAKMQGMTPTVDPASPANLLDARTSASVVPRAF